MHFSNLSNVVDDDKYLNVRGTASRGCCLSRTVRCLGFPANGRNDSYLSCECPISIYFLNVGVYFGLRSDS